MAGRILVGVDGSEGSKRALGWAVQEAAVRGAVVEAAVVWRTPYDLGEAPFLPVDEVKVVSDARERLSQTIAEVAGDRPMVEIDPVVLEGDAAQALCARSARADLLVVGSRGHGGFAGLLLGSVSAKCSHHSRCPVVIVPREEEGNGEVQALS